MTMGLRRMPWHDPNNNWPFLCVAGLVEGGRDFPDLSPVSVSSTILCIPIPSSSLSWPELIGFPLPCSLLLGLLGFSLSLFTSVGTSVFDPEFSRENGSPCVSLIRHARVIIYRTRNIRSSLPLLYDRLFHRIEPVGSMQLKIQACVDYVRAGLHMREMRKQWLKASR